MTQLAMEWIKRLFGYGAVLAAPWVADKTGDQELANWVATGVSIVGAIVLNKAIPYVIPTTRKVEKSPMPGSTLRK